MGFNRQRERFAVMLKDSSEKLFRGCNLSQVTSSWTSIHSSLTEKMSRSKSLESLMKVRSDIENLCDFDEAGVLLRSNCLNKIVCRANDSAILKELVESVEQQIERCAFPHLTVRLKLEQAKLLSKLGKINISWKVLESCVDEHYGRLLTITEKLTKLIEVFRSDKKVCEKLISRCEKLISRCEKPIRSGNYDPIINIGDYYSSLFLFYEFQINRTAAVDRCEMLELFFAKVKEFHEKATKAEIEHLRECREEGQDVERENKVILANRFKRKGTLSIIESNWDEALDIFTKTQGLYGEIVEMNSAVLWEILLYKMECYAQLGDKKKAEKCLERAKRQFPESDYERFEQILSKTTQTYRAPQSHKGRGKCSNPYCKVISRTYPPHQLASVSF